MHIAEDTRVVVMSMVFRGVHVVIQRHGVYTVSARGLPTATPDLTHFLKLDGKQQRCTASVPDRQQMNNLACAR